ncbi:MAG: hypothetical protein GKR93_11855 [Gammaproteobacteria bacterium]|nr:hypothetical protein [Gammaproteobacteria bacterium]
MYHVQYDSEKVGNNILGIFSDDVHDSIPAGCLQITDDQWQDLIDNNGLRRIENDAVVVIDHPLENIKADRISALNESFVTALNGGFDSDALGTTHKYDSEQHNRDWIQASVVSGNIDELITCDDKLANADSKHPRVHTVSQSQQAMKDGMTALLAHKTKFRTLRDSVNAATTKAEVEAIVW